jgi:hypothetical protein
MVLIQPQNMKKFIQNRDFVLGMILLLAISCSSKTGKNYRARWLCPKIFNVAANAVLQLNSIEIFREVLIFLIQVLTLIESGSARE